MTHNHASVPGATPPWPYVDEQAAAGVCKESMEKERQACDPNANPPGATPIMVRRRGRMRQRGMKCTEACAEARACALPRKQDDKRVCCDPNTTGDHLVEVNSFTQRGTRGGLNIGSYAVLGAIGGFSMDLAAPKSRPRRLSEFENYNDRRAPTACVRPPGAGTNHNRMQASRDNAKRNARRANKGVPLTVFITGEESHWTYDQAAKAGVESHAKENPKCNKDCTRAQLDNYHHTILPGDTPAEKNQTPVRTYIPKKK
jgi:GHH signature containing HNH/Endo VII superfamily nuclease toxin  2